MSAHYRTHLISISKDLFLVLKSQLLWKADGTKKPLENHLECIGGEVVVRIEQIQFLPGTRGRELKPSSSTRANKVAECGITFLEAEQSLLGFPTQSLKQEEAGHCLKGTKSRST